MAGFEGLVAGQPVQVARRLRRPGPERLQVDLQARHDAADQRDEQQQVDRREPGRLIDVEQADLVVERPQLRVRLEEVRHLHRIDPGLRDQRAGHRAEGQQEEQHQGCLHRGQLPPGPAQPADQAELGQVGRWGRRVDPVLDVGHLTPPTRSSRPIAADRPSSNPTPLSAAVAPRRSSARRRSGSPAAGACAPRPPRPASGGTPAPR